MSLLKKCFFCSRYTLQDNCPNCGKETKTAHSKFLKIRCPVKKGFFEPRRAG
ncbi:ribosome biogenesis protein [Candidatus Pacearchaeota archaeon]|nr:MAG: ribosome biogenesis protein [Candidatus Pacearchaeota archaeon]